MINQHRAVAGGFVRKLFTTLRVASTFAIARFMFLVSPVPPEVQASAALPLVAWEHHLVPAITHPQLSKQWVARFHQAVDDRASTTRLQSYLV